MSDSEEDWPEWNCFECHRVAVNSVCLDLQMLTKEHVILVHRTCKWRKMGAMHV